MYNLFTLSMIACWAVAAYFFYKVLYNKIKLHNVRLKMQEVGQIDANENITIITLWSFIFWPLPAKKFREIYNQEHKKRINQVNKSLLGLLGAFLFFAFLYTVVF